MTTLRFIKGYCQANWTLSSVSGKDLDELLNHMGCPSSYKVKIPTTTVMEGHTMKSDDGIVLSVVLNCNCVVLYPIKFIFDEINSGPSSLSYFMAF
jgi:hypothetical protein